jgi:thymidylate kinase
MLVVYLTDIFFPIWLKELVSKKRFSKKFPLLSENDKYVELFKNSTFFHKKARLIILEGNPGSGKTTLLESLPNRINKIGQMVLSLPGKKSELFFIKNDIKKYARAERSKNVSVMDRGFVSTLAYNYSKSMVFGNHAEFEKIKNIITSLEKEGRFWVPDCYIFFATSWKDSLKRKDRKQGKNIWCNKKCLNLMNSFCKQFLKQQTARVVWVSEKASASEKKRILGAEIRRLSLKK